MGCAWRRGMAWPVVACVVLGGAVLAWGGAARGQDLRNGEARESAQGEGNRELVQGVILKIETRGGPGSGASEAESDRSGSGLVVISIHTAAIWRDWVRDQATNPAEAGEAAEAKLGTDSVATEGQPASDQTVARVIVSPSTPIEARFRSSTDEATRGAGTPDLAAALDPGADGGSVEAPAAAARDKPSRLTAGELKPGQWVEVEARASDDGDMATKVYVLKPIGGPDTPAEESRPESPEGS